jgi:hypothetical protein
MIKFPCCQHLVRKLLGNSATKAKQLHQIWFKSLKGLKRQNSYVAYVFRRVLISRYTKFGWNQLRG